MPAPAEVVCRACTTVVFVPEAVTRDKLAMRCPRCVSPLPVHDPRALSPKVAYDVVGDDVPELIVQPRSALSASAKPVVTVTRARRSAAGGGGTGTASQIYEAVVVKDKKSRLSARRSDDEDDDGDRKSKKKSRKKSAAGKLLTGLAVGGGALLLLIVLVVVVMSSIGSGGGDPVTRFASIDNGMSEDQVSELMQAEPEVLEEDEQMVQHVYTLGKDVYWVAFADDEVVGKERFIDGATRGYDTSQVKRSATRVISVRISVNANNPQQQTPSTRKQSDGPDRLKPKPATNDPPKTSGGKSRSRFGKKR